VEGGGDGDDGGRTDGRGREGEDGWGGGAVSRMVSGNSGGPVAREPATGGATRRRRRGCGKRKGGATIGGARRKKRSDGTRGVRARAER
jgi:hypothetical protein